MLILSKTDIQKLFTMQDAIQASKEALRIYSEKKSIVPLRLNIDIQKEQGQCLFMPAYAEELNIVGVKIVSIFPHNVSLGKSSISGQMMLIDGKTGEVCAMLDGAYLTQLRTGALQGAATDILARADAKVAVLFGTGGQADAQLEAMLSVRKLEEVFVAGTNFDRTQLFVKAMQKKFASFNTKIVAVKDGNAALKEADIITVVTTSKTPVFDGTLVKKGTHINGIGSFMPDMQELPETIIQPANKIYFDTDAVLAEAGDFIIPLKKGLITTADFDGDLGEVILGTIKGRETEEEVTVFKSVGTAILDLVTAHHIYKKALNQSIEV
jgi:ornithine cyclodeaminase